MDSPRLEYPADIRKRPGMFIGSTGPRGREHILRELVGNAVDQALAGRVSLVSVEVHSDGAMVVSDDGPGIPVHKVEGVPFATRVMTTWRDTPTADGHHPHVHLGIGTGLAVICALSEALELVTHRDGTTWRQSFAAGQATTDLVEEPSDFVGTRLTVRPDPTIFEPGRLDPISITALLRDLAALVPGVSTSLSLDHAWPNASLDTLLPRRGDAHLVEAADGENRVSVAFVIDPYSTGRARGQWFLNLHTLLDSKVLRRCVDDAFAEVLGGRLAHRPRVVVNAMMLSPQFSGPTRSQCDDPRLLALVRRAIVDGVPPLVEQDEWLRPVSPN